MSVFPIWGHSSTSYLISPQERHHTKVQFQLQSDRLSLAQVFSKMEQVVEVLGIEDYSVSQTTLDNVRPSPASTRTFSLLSCTVHL